LISKRKATRPLGATKPREKEKRLGRSQRPSRGKKGKRLGRWERPSRGKKKSDSAAPSDQAAGKKESDSAAGSDQAAFEGRERAEVIYMSQITDQIKDRVDIVELVREYVPQLKKTGASWKSCCPFHQEKTASFLVSPEKQIWHCFGCSKGGDVFGFIREIEGLEFPDALRLLAKRAGVKLEARNPEIESKRARLLEILRLSTAWYHQALLSAKTADKVRKYVADRAISDETRDIWQIGFAPDAWEAVSAYLKSRGYQDAEIAQSGLSSRNDRGGYYDRFRNRLMFPIKDVHGSVVGFTARKMNEEDVGGKYINTPESEVYHKSSVLYGLSSAKKSIRENDLAVIVEGNMDCVSSHQAGVENVVASSGTALTREQVCLLKRFTKNIALSFDPDAAGQDALSRGLEIAWQEEMLVKIIILPEKEDPDNLIKRDVDEWKDRIKKAVPFMDWVIARAEKQHDLTTAQGKREAAKIVLSWISRVPDMIEQTHYLQMLSSKINVSEEVLRSAIGKSHKSARWISGKTPPASPPEYKGGKIGDPNEYRRGNIYQKTIIRLFALMVCDKKSIKIDEDLLKSESLIKLYKMLDKLYDSSIEELDQDIQSISREIIILSEEARLELSPEVREEERLGLINRLSNDQRKAKLSILREKIRSSEQEGNEKALREYLGQFQDIQKE